MSIIREAIENLNEANIWKDEYAVGSKIVIKPSVKKKIPFLSDYPAGSKFTKWQQDKPTKEYDIGGAEQFHLYLRNDKGKVILLTGSKGNINALFNHDRASGKSNTEFLTTLKENISLRLFLEGEISEEQVIDGLSDREKEFYTSVYYTSAVAQLRSIKSFGFTTTSGYYGERQKGKETEGIYKLANKLEKLHPDNWNPADVWLIRTDFLAEFRHYVRTFDTNFMNISNLNLWMEEAIKNKNVLPISLKQVNGDGHTEIIGPNHPINLDFSIDRVDINLKTFNNFIPWTASGFAPRVGFKGSTEGLGVFVEGREKGSKYQLGAVDKKALVKKLENAGAKVTTIRKHNDKLFSKLLKACYGVYSMKMGGKRTTYKEAMDYYNGFDDWGKTRALNLVIYMHAMLIESSAKYGQEEFFEWMYRYSRKITDTSSMYIIVH